VHEDEFDFWLGEWTVRWGEGAHGANRVTKSLGDRVVVEEFDGRPGITLRGMSVSVFDRTAGEWRQTWVDNEGNYLDFRGGRRGEEMDLRRQAGDEWYRMLWTKIRPDSLLWLWQRSADGESWETLWRLEYERRIRGADEPQGRA
jgi:hypothetical protein